MRATTHGFMLVHKNVLSPVDSFDCLVNARGILAILNAIFNKSSVVNRITALYRQTCSALNLENVPAITDSFFFALFHRVENKWQSFYQSFYIE